MYFAIEITHCKPWDLIVPCSTKMIEELSFWDTHVTHLNGKKLSDQPEALQSVAILMHQNRSTVATLFLESRIWSVRASGK